MEIVQVELSYETEQIAVFEVCWKHLSSELH